jgi:hypothetical protein
MPHRTFRPFPLALALLGLAGSARVARAQAGCGAHGGTEYICGVQSVEDLIRIEGTDWVLASQLGPRAGTGGFYLIDVRTRAFHEAAPDFSGRADPIYSRCPGPPEPKLFAAHGIAIRLGSGRVHQAYAVNHGGRESVEVFDLDVRGKEPKLVWKGCALTPETASANSVTPLPDRGFAITSFGVRTDMQGSMAKIGAGQPSGYVTEWSPAAGWTPVPGTEFSGDNGIVASPDGGTLFIAGWGDQAVHVVSRGKTPPTHRAVPLNGFHPDNIRWGPDGSLIVAGQVGELKAIFGCLTAPVCTVGSKVVKIDPKTFAMETLVEEPGNPDFGGAASAIVVGDEVWLGPFRGNRIARVKPRH